MRRKILYNLYREQGTIQIKRVRERAEQLNGNKYW